MEHRELLELLQSQGQTITLHQVVAYETYSRTWVQFVGTGWLQRLVGKWIGRLARRKYNRYLRSLELCRRVKEKLERLKT